MSIPVATAANWMASGTHEPSTAYDTTGDLMWEDRPEEELNRIYFNAITVQGSPALLAILMVSPNVGALESRNEILHNEYHYAYLGRWVDCNGDGYIGMLETAVREYAAAALLDDSICPGTSGDDDEWDGSPNYNGWVTEFMPISRYPIGYNTPEFPDLRVYVDQDAHVWGDYSAPDIEYNEKTCAIAPQPRGTYHSTGGVINYFDCRAGTLGVELLGAFTGTALEYQDVDNAQQPGHPLEHETFGDDDDANSAVKVWDCNSPQADTGVNPPNGPGRDNGNIVIYGPHPDAGVDASKISVDDRSWIAGSFNHTYEPVLGDCNPNNDRGEEIYAGSHMFIGGAGVGEADFTGINPKNKTQADWNFDYQETQRGPVTFTIGRSTEEEIEATEVDVDEDGNPEFVVGDLPVPFNGGSGIDMFDFGIGLMEPSCTTALCYGWQSPSIRLSKIPHLVKADIGNPLASGAPDAYYMQFYAFVSSQATDQGLVLPGGSDAYLSHFCNADGTGANGNVFNPASGFWSKGYSCHGNVWYKNPDGSSFVEPGSNTPADPDDDWNFARPRWTYNLRDVDCYDGSNNAGVPTGTHALLNTNLCAPPAASP